MVFLLIEDWVCICYFYSFIPFIIHSFVYIIRSSFKQKKPQVPNHKPQSLQLKLLSLMLQAFSAEACIFVIILVFYVLTSHIVQLKKVPYVHESSMAILMGMITAAISKYALNQEISFNNQIFFTIILPPIIFSAGYSLRKSLFFQNFAIVAFLGIIGTIIGFLCITGFLIFINSFFFNALTLSQILLMSSVLSATDTVAAMSLIKPQKFPVLNAVLFGEGIINDAVAIILFGTISNLKLDETGGQFTFKVVGQMAFDFCYLFFFSMAFGVFTGFGLSYLFKFYQSFNRHPIKETSLILMNGYFTYLLGQLIGLSGIISLFTCAIIMGHYCFMNISEESQKGTGLAFETVGYMCEAFVFAYLGASILSVDSTYSAVFMGLLTLLALPVVRAIMVYLLPFFYVLARKDFPMNSKQIKICWYSGIMRGVIAFALCLQIDTQNSQFITTVALVIVLATTLIGSSFMKSFANKIGIKDGDEEKDIYMTDDLQRQKTVQIITERLPASMKSIDYNDMVIAGNHENQAIDDEFEFKKNSPNILKKLEQKFIKPIFQKRIFKDSKNKMQTEMENMQSKVNQL